MPAETESREDSQTAGSMSKGAEAPRLALRDATVVGISCMDAVFITTSRHSSFEAELRPERRFSLTAALMPAGVAALPKPSRFADTFDESASIASLSFAAVGKSRPRIGRRSRESFSDNPERRISSITPDQRHIIPHKERHRSTASLAPSAAAAETAGRLPFKAPKTREKITMSEIIRLNSIMFISIY